MIAPFLIQAVNSGGAGPGTVNQQTNKAPAKEGVPPLAEAQIPSACPAKPSPAPLQSEDGRDLPVRYGASRAAYADATIGADPPRDSTAVSAVWLCQTCAKTCANASGRFINRCTSHTIESLTRPLLSPP